MSCCNRFNDDDDSKLDSKDKNLLKQIASELSDGNIDDGKTQSKFIKLSNEMEDVLFSLRQYPSRYFTVDELYRIIDTIQQHKKGIPFPRAIIDDFKALLKRCKVQEKREDKLLAKAEKLRG